MSQDYLDKLIEKDKAGTQIQSIPLHDTELRGITIDDPITVEGNPINFSTKNEQNAIQTVVNLEPIQDLHGYSKPWVGGAGKNIWNIDAYINQMGGHSYTYNNVQVTINSDYSIKLNGTVGDPEFLFPTVTVESGNKYPDQDIYKFLKPSTSYIVSKGISNTDITIEFYYMATSSSGWTKVAYGSGPDLTITTPASWYCLWIRFQITKTKVLNNITIYPMIRLATVTDTTFEPYTNICPILPHEEIKIGGCGKNLFYINDGSYASGSIVVNNGLIKINGTFNSQTVNFYNYSNRGDLNKYIGKQLTFSKIDVKGNLEYNAPFFTAVGNWNYWHLNSNNKNTITHNRMIDTFVMYLNGTYDVEFYLQVEVNYDATEYEPYQESNDISIDLPTTVYGGTLNLETGEMVVDKGYITYDGSSDESWANIPVGSAAAYTMGITTPSNYKQYERTELPNVKANYLFALKQSDTWGNYDGFIANTPYDSKYKLCVGIKSITTVEAFKTYLASNNLQVCYELPNWAQYTLHLTPTQLKLFKDVNNLNSSDYTTLTVTYHSNSIATLSPATDTTDGLLTAMDKRALDRTEEIVEGNPIAFETESAQVAKSTIIDLEPVQDLHGYSKPWVGGAGKNLLPLDVATIKSLNTSGTWNGNIYTIGTRTFTILLDSDNNIIGIKVNGSDTSISTFDIIADNNLNINCILNGCPTGGGEDTFELMAFSGSTSYRDRGSSIDFNWNTNLTLRIIIRNNYSANNLIFKPMIRLSTVTDATFEPYTNIASISGRSEVDILGCGKNLFDASQFNLTAYARRATASISSDNQVTLTCVEAGQVWYGSPISAIGTALNDYYLIPCNGGDSISISIKGNTADAYELAEANSNKILTYYNTSKTTSKFILHDDTKYFTIRLIIGNNVSVGTVWKAYIQIEVGSSISLYEPYIESTSLQIQLGQTVYGGQLDVEKGELVVDRGYVEFDGSEDENWGLSSNSKRVNTMNLSTLVKKADSDTIAENVVSNLFYKESAYNTYIGYEGISVETTGQLNVHKGKTTDTMVLADWITWLSSNNLQVCYELATTTTISLTPEQVKLLQGVNTITTNADNITLTYRNGSVATLNDLESLYAKLKAYIDSLHTS